MTPAEQVTARVRAARMLQLAKRRRRVPVTRYPTLVESDYATQLVAIVGEQRAALAPLLRELPDLAASAWNNRGDQRLDVGEGKRVRVMLDLVRGRSASRAAESAADRAARQVAAHGATELARQTTAALGIPIAAPDRTLPTLAEHFVAENVTLIKSLGSRTLDKVESAVLRGFTSGARHETIGAAIAKEYDIAERHARLIARDQIQRLSSQIERSRHLELGVKSFTWLSADDERTRPTHRAMHKKVWSYEQGGPHPVPSFFPGDEILCRCSQQPLFDDVLAQLSALEAAPVPGVPTPVAPPVAAPVPAPSQTASPVLAQQAAPVAAPFLPPAEKKNPKRVEAARKAAAASVERRREIHSTVKSNLPKELHVVWDQEGHKFMREEAHRIRGVKDRVNAGSKLSEAFAEKYGSGDASVFGNEGDRFSKRAEIEAKHAESWADEQERAYYEAARRELEDRGGSTPNPIDWRPPNFHDDDPPF